jgi:hypothetical protein
VETGAGKDGGLVRARVDDKPVASKVAFAVVFEISRELMIAVDGWEGLSFFEEIDDFGEAGHVTSGSLDFFKVFFETFLEDDFPHQIPKAALASAAV